jgi:hypothetical protein
LSALKEPNVLARVALPVSKPHAWPITWHGGTTDIPPNATSHGHDLQQAEIKEEKSHVISR